MPWCEPCSRFLTPTSLGPGGKCPGCGEALDARADPAEAPEVPWHFKLLVLATVLYLGWRAVQGIAWLAGRL